jgi:hypothetical protein
MCSAYPVLPLRMYIIVGGIFDKRICSNLRGRYLTGEERGIGASLFRWETLPKRMC